MPKWSPWNYSPAHQRFYAYLYGDDDVIMKTIWSDFQEVNGIPTAENETSSADDGLIDNSSAFRGLSLKNIDPGLRPDEAWSQHYGNQSHLNLPSALSYQNKEMQMIEAEGEEGLWDATPKPSPASDSPNPSLLTSNITEYYPSAHVDTSALVENSQDVRASIRSQRRFLRTTSEEDHEALDPSYRRVAPSYMSHFFVRGRVFAMLWTEPAGQLRPGGTRGTSHFSTVRWNESAYSEIRRFVVIRNKHTFSQCMPIQTYSRRGTLRPGIIADDHGVIHTSATPPPLLEGEHLIKQPIRVRPSGSNVLEAESRVNYGKTYAVEHNVKVLNIGMVANEHLHLINAYFMDAITGLRTAPRLAEGMELEGELQSVGRTEPAVTKGAQEESFSAGYNDYLASGSDEQKESDLTDWERI